MTRFQDGPAAGQVLMLNRAPYFLRAVMDHFGKWDALDQLEDKPAPNERLFAYEITEKPGWVHINAGRGKSGMYPSACYRLVNPQPTDSEMRDRWAAWVEATAKARGLK